MSKRRLSKKIFVGNIGIGGDSTVSVQSMLNAKTTDVEGCLHQIDSLKRLGCDLIRLAVPDENSAECFKVIAKKCNEPLIADVHYSYRLAELAVKAGAKKLRINPGNMTADGRTIDELVALLKDYNVPVRIGVNGGSLDKRFKGMYEDEALVASALSTADMLESHGFSDIVIAIKSSDVETMIEANRKLALQCDYPLHLGVTEAGPLTRGLIKSSIGIGTLLQEGLGDTIRVSLTAPIEEEVKAGINILRSIGLRKSGVEIVSCPTCARTEINVEELANKVEKLTEHISKPLKIAVMGCPLNGIDEGKNCDIGIAGGKEKSVLLLNGDIYKTIDSKDIETELLQTIEKFI